MYNQRFKPKVNGAKEGLAQKMKYWESKDYDTEFSIAVSQAVNVAYQQLAGRRAPTQAEVYAVFLEILNYKTDKDFRESFRKYFDIKINTKAREIEKEEQRLDEAGGGVDDFGDEPPQKEQENLI